MSDDPFRRTAPPTGETNPTRHERENAARDLARDFIRMIERGDTRLAWESGGSWNVDSRERKFDLEGPAGLSARVTIYVSGIDDDC